MRVFLILNLTVVTFTSSADSAPQQTPEINDQFVKPNNDTAATNKTQHAEIEADSNVVETTSIDSINVSIINNTKIAIADRVERSKTALLTVPETESFITTIYISIKKPIIKFIETPKVNIVLRNIGTCVVNGAMEIVSYYFPTPLIPLIASAAGMLIPFEPIVMLKNRMPVTSYRRAFSSAFDSFMGTFNKFKTSEEDPYMTRSFNRRFMGGKSGEGNVSR